MSQSGSDCEVGEKALDALETYHDDEEGYLVAEHDNTASQPFTQRLDFWRTGSYQIIWTTRKIVLAGGLAFTFLMLYWTASSTRVASGVHNAPSWAHIPFWTSKPADPEPFFQSLYEKNLAAPAQFPHYLETARPTDFCSLCDCTASPAYYSPNLEMQANLGFAPRPLDTHIHPTPDTVDVNEFVRLSMLDIYCARQHLSTPQALNLVSRTSTHFDDMMSWSLAGLKIGAPTIYVTTATSADSKAGPFRPQYFRRHGRAIRAWMAQQEQRMVDMANDEWAAKRPHDSRDWQIIWIIAEDSVEVDPQLVRTLQRTGVPYLYFAYGTTKAWGNAQKNAVLQTVYALSRPGSAGLYGVGPIYGMDDDNKVIPNLFDLLTKVVQIGVFPVGNLGPGWETAIVDDDLGAAIGGLFDYASFTYNSSLLGTLISGPSFWKHDEWGGEGHFLQQLTKDFRNLELLCGKSAAEQENCHNVWHNQPLSPMELLTDEEEIAYVQKNGAAKLFRELGFEMVGDGKSNSTSNR